MPQIKNVPGNLDRFLRFLKSRGIEVTKTVLPVASFMPTQSEFNEDIVKDIVDKLHGDPDSFDKNKLILLSKDKYILDGHHRWLALYNYDPHFMAPVIVINADIDTLVEVAHSWDGVTYKTLKEFLEHAR